MRQQYTEYRNRHRGSPPISPFAAIGNIEKFDLTTSFFSNLLETAAMLSAVGDVGSSNCNRLLNVQIRFTFR